VKTFLSRRDLRPRAEKDEKKPEKTVKHQPLKCNQCRQILDDPDLKLFPGDSEEAVSISFVFENSFSNNGYLK
jgi:hypothetical protein